MIDEKGFYRPTYNELLEKQVSSAKKIFGEDIDTGETSLFGKFLRLMVYDVAKIYEELETVYYARFPNTAGGTSLDRLCTFAGISRNAPTYAMYNAELKCDSGYTVPVGFLIGNGKGINYYNTKDTVADSTGRCNILVQAVEAGIKGNVASSTINTIINPCAEVKSIVKVTSIDGSEARDEETDEELRTRFNQAITGSGLNSLLAVKGAVSRVAGVNGVVIAENCENTTVSGRPPHSFEVYADYDGDIDDKIGQAIFDKKPMGIKSYGSNSASIKDNSGTVHNIYFTKVERVPIDIVLEIEKDSSFGNDGADEIKRNIANYINCMEIGQDLIVSVLYKEIYAVNGVKAAKISLAEAADGDIQMSDGRLVMAKNQRMYGDIERISISNEVSYVEQ